MEPEELLVLLVSRASGALRTWQPGSQELKDVGVMDGYHVTAVDPSGAICVENESSGPLICFDQAWTSIPPPPPLPTIHPLNPAVPTFDLPPHGFILDSPSGSEEFTYLSGVHVYKSTTKSWTVANHQVEDFIKQPFDSHLEVEANVSNGMLFRCCFYNPEKDRLYRPPALEMSHYGFHKYFKGMHDQLMVLVYYTPPNSRRMDEVDILEWDEVVRQWVVCAPTYKLPKVGDVCNAETCLGAIPYGFSEAKVVPSGHRLPGLDLLLVLCFKPPAQSSLLPHEVEEAKAIRIS